MATKRSNDESEAPGLAPKRPRTEHRYRLLGGGRGRGRGRGAGPPQTSAAPVRASTRIRAQAAIQAGPAANFPTITQTNVSGPAQTDTPTTDQSDVSVTNLASAPAATTSGDTKRPKKPTRKLQENAEADANNKKTSTSVKNVKAFSSNKSTAKHGKAPPQDQNGSVNSTQGTQKYVDNPKQTTIDITNSEGIPKPTKGLATDADNVNAPTTGAIDFTQPARASTPRLVLKHGGIRPDTQVASNTATESTDTPVPAVGMVAPNTDGATTITDTATTVIDAATSVTTQHSGATSAGHSLGVNSPPVEPSSDEPKPGLVRDVLATVTVAVPPITEKKTKGSKTDPKTSAGRLFHGLFAPDVDETFKIAMTTPTAVPEKYETFGIKNEGDCSYRNAVLMALLHSHPFHRLLSEHAQSSHTANMSEEEKQKQIMVHVHAMLSGLSEDTPDELNTAVQVFWKKFCFPTGPADEGLLPKPPSFWGSPSGQPRVASEISTQPEVYTTSNGDIGQSNDGGSRPTPTDPEQTPSPMKAKAVAISFIEWLFQAIQAQNSKLDDQLTTRVNFATRLSRQARVTCTNCKNKVALRNPDSYNDFIHSLHVPMDRNLGGFYQDPLELTDLFAHNMNISLADFRKSLCCNGKSAGSRCSRCKRFWTCGRCKKSDMSGTIRYTVGHAPPMLMIHLDRLSSKVASTKPRSRTKKATGIDTSPDVTPQKNISAVRVPHQFDLTKYLDPTKFGNTEGQVKYRLSSIVSHQGAEYDLGHYVAWVQPEKPLNWYLLNDDAEPRFYYDYGPIDRHGNKGAFMLDVYEERPNRLGPLKTKTPSYKEEHAWHEKLKIFFEQRATPVLLIFERDYEKEAKQGGRPARNRDQGMDNDTELPEVDEIFPEPEKLARGAVSPPLPGEQEQMTPIANHFVNNTNPGHVEVVDHRPLQDRLASEKEELQQDPKANMADTSASLRVLVKIDGEEHKFKIREFQLNRFVKPQIDISITADHQLPVGQGKVGKRFNRIDLLDAYYAESTRADDIERDLRKLRQELRIRGHQAGLSDSAILKRKREDDANMELERKRLCSTQELDKEWYKRWYYVDQSRYPPAGPKASETPQTEIQDRVPTTANTTSAIMAGSSADMASVDSRDVIDDTGKEPTAPEDTSILEPGPDPTATTANVTATEVPTGDALRGQDEPADGKRDNGEDI